MKMKKSAVAIVLAVCSLGSYVFAEMNTNASLELKVTNDDNIYYEKTDPQSSMITAFIPGLNFSASNDANKLGLDYTAEILNYSFSPSTNNATNQAVGIMGELVFPFGLSIKLRDAYKDTNDAPSSEFVKRINRIQNNLNAEVGYKINRLVSASIVMNQVKHEYSEAIYKPLFNRSESETGLIVFYGISPKTSALLEYDMNKIVYDNVLPNRKDSSETKIKLGLKGKLTPKTVGILKVGSTDRKYDLIANTNNVADSMISLNSITEFSKMTNLKLLIDRNIQESVYANNAYYISTGLTADLGQKIGSSWGVNLNVRTEMGAYPNETTSGALTAKRADTNNSLGLSIGYNAMDWLTANIGFTTKSRSSNFDEFNYTDNVSGIGI